MRHGNKSFVRVRLLLVLAAAARPFDTIMAEYKVHRSRMGSGVDGAGGSAEEGVS